ncbi:hypothetical protein AOR01nite_01390 [Acetobacter orleanensis]|uniref:Uncharacterized protein n=1 Tax=Acetobacter orleanensis TaxID=104099 RepID=A0A4Y3TI68_9PROT|nr:hypothetical protein Abol_024_069 [Acetobacter orleanensis JCM 7639]GEB81662.1 hypothetical protein AOR01nite_01390 [Acetobacter orleanensis]
MKKNRSWWNSSWSPHSQPISSQRQQEEGKMRSARRGACSGARAGVKVTRVVMDFILCHNFRLTQFSSLRERSSIA